MLVRLAFMTAPSTNALFGRLAVHYKLLTLDQLNELTKLQARTQKRLGELLVEHKYATPQQVEKLVQVQAEMLAKQAAQAAPAAAPTAAPAPTASRVTSSTPSAAKPAATPIGAITPERVSAPVAYAEPESIPLATEPITEKDLISGIGRSRHELDGFLGWAVQQGASDIHLHAGAPVRIRVAGQLRSLGPALLDRAKSELAVQQLLHEDQLARLNERGQLDFSLTVERVGRFRCNAFRQQRGTDVVLRAIPPEPPTLSQLGLPQDLARFTNFHQGLVLLTGPAGCGKSSTMAALVSLINEERRDHIITVEDPIEYLHRPKRCSVNQRQVGPHTESFARALRAALREDPDVIALGELRDLETISLALTAAETGHLVLATLHTNSAIRTVNRILGVFPPEQQAQIRTMVSESLRAVVSQRLVPRADGKGRVAALEVMVGTKAIGNMIRDDKTFQLRSLLQTGAAQGMMLLDNSLAELVKKGVITKEEAARQSDEPQRFK